MIRKITTLSLCIAALIMLKQKSFAQEEGGTVDKTHEEIAAQKDSALVFESGEIEQLIQPTATPFNIPVKESQKKSSTSPAIEVLSEKSVNGQVKSKETKQDFSFNIIYYLIYKFKQVDN